eukprot:m.234259 g.234259  ORF g.234259 m.234259 type:complete len:67 (+) comp40107_c1_seq14:536-736(+)
MRGVLFFTRYLRLRCLPQTGITGIEIFAVSFTVWRVFSILDPILEKIGEGSTSSVTVCDKGFANRW